MLLRLMVLKQIGLGGGPLYLARGKELEKRVHGLYLGQGVSFYTLWAKFPGYKPGISPGISRERQMLSELPSWRQHHAAPRELKSGQPCREAARSGDVSESTFGGTGRGREDRRQGLSGALLRNRRGFLGGGDGGRIKQPGAELSFCGARRGGAGKRHPHLYLAPVFEERLSKSSTCKGGTATPD